MTSLMQAIISFTYIFYFPIQTTWNEAFPRCVEWEFGLEWGSYLNFVLQACLYEAGTGKQANLTPVELISLSRFGYVKLTPLNCSMSHLHFHSILRWALARHQSVNVTEHKVSLHNLASCTLCQMEVKWPFKCRTYITATLLARAVATSNPHFSFLLCLFLPPPSQLICTQIGLRSQPPQPNWWVMWVSFSDNLTV